METQIASVFQSAALASGLLTHTEINEAMALLRPAPSASAPAKISDKELADKLVELGRLTGYQAEQLLRGNKKLNLGPYQITDSIGQGGMGQVFKAEHTMMGRIVAVKVLPRSKSTPEAIGSFTREIRAQAQLDHHNLVRAYDAGHDGNVYFLVTEYVPGTDLRKYVRTRGPMNMVEAATVISQAAKGLQHAHSRGLIHRDVKPGNLLVTPEGLTKVSDLGLAGSLVDADDDPRAGKVVGTADYLSPEQILTPRAVTATSDIYGLGCTLYYAVTGKVPYPGGTTREKAHRHCEGTPIHPRHFNPGLTDDFIDVIADMMEKDSKKRIQTAAQVVERLAPWAGESVPGSESIGDPAKPPVRAPLGGHTPLIELVDADAGFPEIFIGDATQLESPSQVSQVTDPVASGDEETLPVLKTDLPALIGRGRSLLSHPAVASLLVPGILMAILVILVAILWAIL